MSDTARVDLVSKAIHSGLSNCLEWIDAKAEAIVRRNVAGLGLTPPAIRRLLIAHVRAGGVIHARREERDHWKDRREFWYRAIVPIEGMAQELFVEMELFDADPDVPVVLLLNAHPQCD